MKVYNAMMALFMGSDQQRKEAQEYLDSLNEEDE
jgi:hypothetical protein